MATVINASPAGDSEPVGWDIISEVWSDFRDASGPRSLDRRFREVGTQIFAETFEIPKTRKNTRYHWVANEVAHRIVALPGKLKRQLSYAHRFVHDFDISHRTMEKKEKHIGFRVDEFHSKIGKAFPILSERYLRSGVLMLVNTDAFSYGHYENDSLERTELPASGRYQRWLISFRTYGLVARAPRANIGMIHGLPGE